MKASKKLGLGIVSLVAVMSLAACGGSTKSSSTGKTDAAHSAALITDTNGVDDKSFNQSAWEGMKKWGKSEGLKEGKGGYAYFSSSSESDYKPNVDQAVAAGFKTIYGVGYLLKNTIEESAAKNADTNFVIVDDVITGKKNVVSATFKDNESAYLAGIAAAKSTKTKQVGFIGGIEGEVIDRFEAGFKAGVKSVDASITVKSQYAGSFGAPDKGKTIAAAMYQSGSDIIYQAAGATGAGVFSEAKAINTQGDKKVWVIGVDRDQQADGSYTAKDGKKANFTLTSTVKGVNQAVVDINTQAKKDKFPGGKHLVYGLKENGVSLTDGQLSDTVKTAVKEAKEKIISGAITVPEKP